MGSRRALLFGTVVLGILTPIVPRALLAVLDAEEAERFSGWLGRAFSMREVPDWAWVLSPFVVLSTLR